MTKTKTKLSQVRTDVPDPAGLDRRGGPVRLQDHPRSPGGEQQGAVGPPQLPLVPVRVGGQGAGAERLQAEGKLEEQEADHD